MSYDSPAQLSALEAKTQALKLSFAPFSFQATCALLELGILKQLGEQGEAGLNIQTLSQALELSEYGVKVLLEMGLSLGLVWQEGDRFILDKTGHFILTDKMVQVNLNFTQHFCYQGLAALTDSVRSGCPEGLKVFGQWPTVYPALSSLPEPAKKTWFDFDHFYSDQAFDEVLSIVFSSPVQRLFDIGGNTGKWTRQCLAHDANVLITIVDLPEQCVTAKAEMSTNAEAARVSYHPTDLLNPENSLPAGADVLWMSQFLDCFNESQALSILKRAAETMGPDSRLCILETFWDRQYYDAATFCVLATSLYFTCMANGNSRMFHSKELVALIEQAGLVVSGEFDRIGVGHTLLLCQKK